MIPKRNEIVKKECLLSERFIWNRIRPFTDNSWFRKDKKKKKESVRKTARNFQSSFSAQKRKKRREVARRDS